MRKPATIAGMTETTFWKATVAVYGAMLLQWQGLPASTRVLFWMIVLDVAIGAWANRDHFSASKLVLRLFGKVFACGIMITAFTLMQWGGVITWDLAAQFTQVATIFELGSVIQSYSKLRAPGAEWLNAVYGKLRAIAAAAPEQLNQEQVSAKLDAAKQAGLNP